ncbi:MAG: hypothetical protein NTX39_09415 [Opitutae bacterium]|nr:hypothetical protein [Opitutae bacterium]
MEISRKASREFIRRNLRAFSTTCITYNLQHGQWPADKAARVIPAEMAGFLGAGFECKSPIGGYYEWGDRRGDCRTAPDAVKVGSGNSRWRKVLTWVRRLQ